MNKPVKEFCKKFSYGEKIIKIKYSRWKLLKIE